MREPGTRRGAAILASGILFAVAATPPAHPQAPERTLADELIVTESSILLQRAERTRIEEVEIDVDGSSAEPVAIYRLTEVEFPTTVYVDLCAASFSRLTRAVGMIAAVEERLLEMGPLSVVAGGADGHRVLLEGSRDALSFEAALTVLLRAPLGGCDDASPLAALERMRRALGGLAAGSTAPSLLLVYGYDHGSISAEDLRRFQPEYAAIGAQLAGRGRTAVVLLPDDGDRKLEEKEVRSLLPDPEGPPRVIDLGAVLGSILSPRRYVPNDPRIIEIATDPRNELVRDLIGPGEGRLLAFHRQLEAFVRDLSDYHVLFYRSERPPTAPAETLVPIAVRAGASGRTVRSAALAALGAPPAEDTGPPEG